MASASNIGLPKTDLTLYAKHKQLVGSGTMGQLFIYKHKLTNKKRAVRLTDKSGDRIGHSTARELAPALHQQHNLIRLVGVANLNKKLAIVYDYCHGSLKDVLTVKNILDPIEVESVLKQVADGLSYLHKESVAHLNLKPANILMKTDDGTKPSWHDKY